MLLFCDVLYLYVNIRMTIYLVHGDRSDCYVEKNATNFID